jgi:hypothetical protein
LVLFRAEEFLVRVMMVDLQLQVALAVAAEQALWDLMEPQMSEVLVVLA